MSTRLPTIAVDVTRYFASREAELVDIPVLQPADPFLDTAGEDLRSRIFLTASETGESLCLRPEFTIPVCLGHIETRSATPHRYAYVGEVFRQRREAGNEFFQAGIEDLGNPDIAASDARSLADAAGLLRVVLPDARFSVTLGDQAVFEAVLAALGLPRGWQKRLARAFGAPGQLEAALDALAGPSKTNGRDSEIAVLTDRGDHGAVAAFVEKRMKRTGMSPHAGRSPDEIATRLLEKIALENTRLPETAIDALRRFLAIHEPLDKASETLEHFADAAGIRLGGAIERFRARARAIQSQGIDTASVTYDAAFGRPLDYYTGLVFEIRSEDDAVVLCGGGRYDRLLTLLGAPEPITGVGFSVWLDRVEKRANGGQGK
jgi:ATP phosphoribosyltransferase regulatory subunit